MKNRIKKTKLNTKILTPIFILLGVIGIQMLLIGFGLFSGVTNVTDVTEETDEDNIITEVAGNNPNLTREDYPFVLNQESTPDLFAKLHNHDVDNFRVLYYSLDNEWFEVPFQLDEKAYFRQYTMELGAGIDGSIIFGTLTADLSSWTRFDTQHRYAGKNIDDDSSVAYAEPTKYECDMSYWALRQLENWQPPDDPPTTPVQDPDELAGGPKEQLIRRVDWDDEICFYAQNGKKASKYDWWNYNEYPYRFKVEVNDLVDGGQSWMYIYYNNDSLGTHPDYNYYIPSVGPHNNTDYVNWEKANKRIKASTYEIDLMDDNVDEYERLTIKWPGLATNDLLLDDGKWYISINFHIAALGLVDLYDDTEVWREGMWDEISPGRYDEQWSAIGYDIPCSWSWGGDNTGERRNAELLAEGQIASNRLHTAHDAGNTIAGFQIAADFGDRDGDTSEVMPFYRGRLTLDQASNDSAIDGPCRVILDKISLQSIRVDVGDASAIFNTFQLRYEELWTVVTNTLTYYSQMYQSEPFSLNLTFDVGLGEDFTLELYPHYAFMLTQRYSPFVRGDDDALITLGRAPNGMAGLPSFTQCYAGSGKTWPLYCTPDGITNNDPIGRSVTPGGNPNDGYYSNGNLVGGDRNANPLSDWRYLYTSSGGMWSYIPFQEMRPLFSANGYQLCTYWRDDTSGGGDYSEMGAYGNHGNINGATDEYITRFVFGNFTEYECYREYARTKLQLNDYVVVTWETPPDPGDPKFEDTAIYINGEEETSYVWVKDGDQVDLIVDLEGDYTLGEISADFINISTDPLVVTETQIDPVLFKYNLSKVINTIGKSDRVPPADGYEVWVTVTNSTPPEASGYTIFEMYLDNTAPNAPTLVTATPQDLSIRVAWSGATDNGQISHYEIYRNGTYAHTAGAGESYWIDTNVQNKKSYSYVVRVIDMVGLTDDSDPPTIATVDFIFDPAQPDDPVPYFNNYVTIDWSANPGNTSVIDLYRVEWCRTASGTYTPLGWQVVGDKNYNFYPLSNPPFSNGTYYFKVTSRDTGGDVNIRSGPVSSLFDTEDPISPVIEEIPDLYHPTTAEIHVHWAGEWDAFSGIDHYILERSIVSGSSGFSQIGGTFGPFERDYYDTDLVNYNLDEEYWYRVTVYDRAGNSEQSQPEYVHYYTDQLDTSPNLKIKQVHITEKYVERTDPFEVTIEISNLGINSGTVQSLGLEMTLQGTGVVTYQYNNIEESGTPLLTCPGQISTNYTFTSDPTSIASAYEGQIIVDANMTWQSGYDDAADTTDTIWIRDFSALTIADEYAVSPVNTGSVDNIVNMTVTNNMITSVNINDYAITVDGWATPADYTVNDAPGNHPKGTPLAGGQTTTLTFLVDIESGASGGSHNIDFSVTGTEVISGTDASDINDNGASWNVVAPDSQGPTITGWLVETTPNLELGDTQVIRCNATDVAGVAFVRAWVQQPDTNTIANLLMTPFGGTGYRVTWTDATANEALHFVDFYAEDTLGNPTTENNRAQFTVVDTTGPIITNMVVDTTPNLELGNTQVIRCNVTDYSGVGTVTAYVQYSDSTVGPAVTMSVFGGTGYRGTWDSSVATNLGAYTVDFEAADLSVPPDPTYENNPGTANFNLVDTQGPSLSSPDIDPNLGEPGTLFTISVDASDLSGIASVWATIRSGGGWVDAVQLIYTGAGDTYDEDWNSVGFALGDYTVDINATDGNALTSSLTNVDGGLTLGDATPPVMTNPDISPATGDPDAGTIFTITCNVSDALSGIYEVKAFLQTNLDATFAEVTLTPWGGTGYKGTWDSTDEPTKINLHIDINVTDSSPNRNNQYNDRADTFQLIDATGPEITSEAVDLAVGDPSPPSGDVFTISADVEDLSGVTAVWATIRRQGTGAFVDAVQLTVNGAPNYDNTWDCTNFAVGNYYIDINATDGTTYSYSYNADTFILRDDSGPIITSGQVDAPSFELGETYTVSAIVSDFTGLFRVYATIRTSGGSWVAGFRLYDDGSHGDLVSSDGNFTNTWDTSSYSEGANYDLDINATDSSPQSNPSTSAAVDTFNINDSTGPSITGEDVNPTGGPIGTIFTISADVTDLSGINIVYWEIRNNTGWADWVNGSTMTGGPTYSGKWFTSGLAAGDYQVRINATDSSSGGNTNMVIWGTVTLTADDTEGPTITNIQVIPSRVNPEDSVTITAIITDGSGVANANLTISNNSWSVVLQMYDDGAHGDGGVGDGVWGAIWSTGLQHGADIYDISFNATDGWAPLNLRYLENITIVEITNDDIKIPEVENIVNLAASYDVGDQIVITCNATDDVALASVEAYIQDSGFVTVAIVTLVVWGGTGRRGVWDSTAFAIDTYYLDINATDTSDNTNYTNNADSFNLIDDTGPTISGESISSATVDRGVSITILCNVSDPSGIDTIVANIQRPDGTVQTTIPMTVFGGTGRRAIWDTTGWALATNYYIDINATDDSSNHNAAGFDNVGGSAVTVQDTTDPLIQNENIWYTTVELGALQIFNVTVTDDSGITSVYATIRQQGSGNWIAAIQLLDNGLSYDGGALDDMFGGSWDSSGFAEDNYYAEFNATDGSTVPGTNSIVSGSVENFDVQDRTAPTISSILALPVNLELGALLTIQCDVTDESAILGVTAYLDLTNSTTLVLAMSNVGGNTYRVIWDSNRAPEGVQWLDINATDDSASENENYLNNYDSTNIRDTTVPSILGQARTPASGDPSPASGQIFSIRCNITDESDLLAVTVYIQTSLGVTVDTVAMTPFGGNGYRALWDSTGFAEGSYWIDINATDDSNNQNENYANNILSLTLDDVTNPTVTNIAANPDPLELGGILVITCNASDFSGIASVFAIVQDPTQTVNVSILMTSFGGTGYRAVWASIILNSQLGTYYVDIVATDGSNAPPNKIRDETTSFTHEDTTAPTIQNPDINPDSGEIADPFGISVDLSDLSDISEANATITDASTGDFIASVALYDPETDGTWEGIWDSTGFGLGFYNLSINATDGSAAQNVGYANNTETIQLFPTVPTFEILSQNGSITFELYTDGIVQITFPMKVDREDINITDIHIIFVNPTIQAYFALDNLNFTLNTVLQVVDGWVWVGINYTIVPGSPITEAIQNINISVTYRDVPTRTLFTYDEPTNYLGFPGISFYTVPEITSVSIDTGGKEYLKADSTVYIYILGTHHDGGAYEYNAYVDLTAWNIPGLTIEKAGWSGSNYTLEVTEFINLPSNIYLGAQISVILNISMNIAGYREDTQVGVLGEFKVDANNPIINTDQIIVSAIADAGGFWFVVNITDDKSSIWSGIASASIEFVCHNNLTEKDYVIMYILAMQNFSSSPDLWRVLISPANVALEQFTYLNAFRFIKIEAYDKAGNKADFQNINDTVKMIDNTIPGFNLGAFIIGGQLGALNGSIPVPARQFIRISIIIDEASTGSGIRYVRIYYTTDPNPNISIAASSTTWSYIELINSKGNEYFGFLSAANGVGFAPGQIITLYLVVADNAGNTNSTYSSPITLTVYEVSTLFSMTFLIIAFGSLFAAIAYRFTVHRKRAGIIDLETNKEFKYKKKKVEKPKTQKKKAEALEKAKETIDEIKSE